MDLKEISLVNPETNWYYQAKSFAIKSLIQKYTIKTTDIVDVGAGSGFFGKTLLAEFPESNLICVDTNYEEERIESPKLKFVKNSHKVNGNLYLFIDVLEHVDDDYALAREYIDKAPVNSAIIITVPAFMFLWSGHDVFLEHKKRYTKKELEKLCNNLQIEKLESGYLFATIFPLEYLVRKITRVNNNQSSMREFHPILNSLLKISCKFEHRYLRNPLFGLSTFIVATKK